MSAPAPGVARYARARERDGAEPVELPVEDDGSLLLSTVAAQFDGCTGLKYRPDAAAPARGLRLADGRLYPPPDGGWARHDFVCVFPRRPQQQERERPPRKSDKCTDLIVLGLPWKTDEEAIRRHFATFGELLLAQVKRDPRTGASKGFGFVKFRERDAQTRALAQRHLVDGRWCDVRVPNSKEGLAPRPPPTKVFVGRCTEQIGADDLREYFSKFGRVTDVFVPRPFRAFGFVTFLDPDVAQSLCGEDHIVKGVSVNVSSASPKRDRRHQPPQQPPHQQHRRQRSIPPPRTAAVPPPPPPHHAMQVAVDHRHHHHHPHHAHPAHAHQGAWGLVNGAAVDAYRRQPPPPTYVNWAPPPPNGAEPPPPPWTQHRPDAQLKTYVKYE